MRYDPATWPRCTYTLTDEELVYVTEIAHRRARGKGRDGYVGSVKQSVEAHETGVIGEYIVAQLTGGVMDTNTYRQGNKTGIAVRAGGLTLDVVTRRERGWDYALDGVDLSEFKADVGVLVWPAFYPNPLSQHTPAHPPNTWEAVGYITRPTFQVRHRIRDYQYGQRAIVPDSALTPFAYLVDILRADLGVKEERA